VRIVTHDPSKCQGVPFLIVGRVSVLNLARPEKEKNESRLIQQLPHGRKGKLICLARPEKEKNETRSILQIDMFTDLSSSLQKKR
jgi:hypothetical protein